MFLFLAVSEVVDELDPGTELYAVDPQLKAKAVDLSALLKQQSTQDFELKYVMASKIGTKTLYVGRGLEK